MEIAEAAVSVLMILLGIGAFIAGGMFLFWIGRILCILPSYMERITVAFEKIANKK